MQMYMLVVAITVATIALFQPRKRNLLASCEELISKMPNGEYEILCDFLPDETNASDVDFWPVSKGCAGLIKRIRVSYLCLRLVQAFRREGRVGRDDARIIWAKMTKQMVYSLIAVPEAAVCYFVNDARHIAARESVRFYCELIVRTSNLCVTNNAPECMFKLHDLL